MTNPSLNLRPPDPEGRKSGKNQRRNQYGYAVDFPQEAVEDSLHQAQIMVETAQRAGNNIRLWTEKALSEVGCLLNGSRTKYKGRRTKKIPLTELEKRIWEVTYWETEISRSIRRYFGELTDLMNALKLLNPPLKSKQIQPFVNRILEDRRSTLTALDPLSQTMDQLVKLKNQLSVESPHIVPFRPEP